MRVCRLILALSVVMCAMQSSALSFEINSSRANMLGGALALRHPGATDFLAAPGLFGADRALSFEAGVARQFDISDLDIGFLAFGYRHGNLQFAFGAQQLGATDYFAEQTAQTALGYQLGNVSAGLTLSAKRFQFGSAYSSLSAGAIGFGVGLRHKQGAIHVALDNLNRPSFTGSAPSEPQRAALYFELAGSKSYTLSAVARFAEYSKPDFGIGQTVALTDFARLSWGISSEPLIYGAGFEIRKGRITFIYAGSIHTTLGYSQSLTLSMRLAPKKKRLAKAGK